MSAARVLMMSLEFRIWPPVIPRTSPRGSCHSSGSRGYQWICCSERIWALMDPDMGFHSPLGFTCVSLERFSCHPGRRRSRATGSPCM
eukprot:6712954-Pyramimonas_sp.AAC.1